jgi:phytoene dehydrogenase-like protein
LGQKGLAWLSQGLPLVYSYLPQLAADAFRPVAAHLRHAPERLRLFVDGQLLIAAQATSRHVNALYGAAALDLPRRGVVHLTGGMGAVAETLAETVRRHGGQVHYRQEVRRIVSERGRPVAVETKRGKSFPADIVIANLTPWNVAALLGENLPNRLRRLSPQPEDVWGAFMVYMGLDAAAVPANFPLHHQVILREPMAEGNTIFMSLSPAWDKQRGPAGQRALTISSHTRLKDWWDLFERDRAAYEARKGFYTERILAAAEIALPGSREAANLILPGTPVTFQRFTHRARGWVGGFPQTNLFRTWAPRLAPGLWLVGDTIFPGQSTAAVALGGLRVAQTILEELGVRAESHVASPLQMTHPLESQKPSGVST